MKNKPTTVTQPHSNAHRNTKIKESFPRRPSGHRHPHQVAKFCLCSSVLAPPLPYAAELCSRNREHPAKSREGAGERGAVWEGGEGERVRSHTSIIAAAGIVHRRPLSPVASRPQINASRQSRTTVHAQPPRPTCPTLPPSSRHATDLMITAHANST